MPPHFPLHQWGCQAVIISPERIAQIERRHADLAAQMGNPALAADKFVHLSKDYAELTPVVEAAARDRFALKIRAYTNA